jgi:hypothetical protein
MNLGADMMRDQADDALAIGGGQRRPCRKALRQPVDQSRPSGLSITSTSGIFQKRAIGGRGRAQHPRAA